MLRASSAAILSAAFLGPVAAPALAQATLRPLPRVARSWEAGIRPVEAGFARPSGPSAEGRSGRGDPAATARDLDFIGPRPLDREGPPGPGEPDAFDTVELELFGRGTGSATFEGSGGSLTTQRGGWSVALGERTTRGFSYAIEFGIEGCFYDFGGGATPVPGVSDPFNDVYDTRLAARFLHQSAGRTDIYGGLQVGNAGEDAVGVDESLYLGGALALRYAAADDLALVVGVAGISRFDDSPFILPYFGFDWQISEELRLLTEAAEIHLDYRLTDDLSLGLEAVYDFRQYRLNDSGPMRGGSFRDEEIRAGTRLAWNLTDDVVLELSGGKLLWRETTFHDGQTGFVGEAETSSSIYAGLGLRVSF